jgi:hypothetical protein
LLSRLKRLSCTAQEVIDLKRRAFILPFPGLFLMSAVRTSGGKLAEARSRVTELEANQVAYGLSLKACGELSVLSMRLQVSLTKAVGESMRP